MKVVVKLGGTLLDDAAVLKSLARQLAELSRNEELVVVHGGGKQVTRRLEERGVKSTFVGGLRVSDAAVVQAVIEVIAGGVNKALVSALIGAGETAIGLSGIDGCLTVASQLDPALGQVGQPTHTDRRLLDLLVNAGYLPVIACVAGDRQGNTFNVNADSMAVSCAVGWGAAKLLFLTDVPGVKDAGGSVLRRLSPPAIAGLIASGIATGGMQAKLEAALRAIEGGTAEVVIAAGREDSICNRLVAGENIGTRVGGALEL